MHRILQPAHGDQIGKRPVTLRQDPLIGLDVLTIEPGVYDSEQLEGRHGRIAPLPFHNENRREFRPDRKSTRLNSSHTVISYAVFCLKKKKKTKTKRK